MSNASKKFDLKQSPLQSAFWMLITCTAFAIYSLIIDVVASDFGAFQLFAMVSLICLIILLPHLFSGRINLKHLLSKLLVLRALIICIAMSLWIYGLKFVPIADAVAISYCLPIFNSLAGIFYLKEQPTTHRMVSILLGVVGVAIILKPCFLEEFNLGIFVVILVPILWCVSDIILKLQTKNSDLVTQTFGLFLYSFLFALPFTILEFKMPNPEEIAWIGLASVFFAINALGVFAAYRIGEIGYVASYDFIRLIITAFAACYFLDEMLPQEILIGSIIIFSSTLILGYFEYKRHLGQKLN